MIFLTAMEFAGTPGNESYRCTAVVNVASQCASPNRLAKRSRKSGDPRYIPPVSSIAESSYTPVFPKQQIETQAKRRLVFLAHQGFCLPLLSWFEFIQKRKRKESAL
jgi:hypothetical protein